MCRACKLDQYENAKFNLKRSQKRILLSVIWIVSIILVCSGGSIVVYLFNKDIPTYGYFFLGILTIIFIVQLVFASIMLFRAIKLRIKSGQLMVQKLLAYQNYNIDF